ncbi:glutamate cyclase domain-containing protein [Trujillonella humicola]|uniref:glutamate cyclase domain-containing protein n=1 Tax=Trujillonella humicola TaxID=3383699 RepID=UPI0039065347
MAALGAAVPGQLGRLAAVLAGAATAGRRIGLVTGVHIAWAPRPAAETDGPVGAAVLARALTLLGGAPVVLTDAWCGPVVDACLAAVGCPAAVVLPRTAGEDDVRAAVHALDLAALVAVERLGPNRHGRVMTMRAVDITASTAPLHAAFALPGLLTGAVGDGGNEIGMGNVPLDVVAAAVPHGSEIACRTPVGALVVAGTSNWGCYGLVAALARAVPDRGDGLRALLDPALDLALLDAASGAGGIDGVTGEPGPTVDGVPAAAYAGLLADLAALSRGEDR